MEEKRHRNKYFSRILTTNGEHACKGLDYVEKEEDNH